MVEKFIDAIKKQKEYTHMYSVNNIREWYQDLNDYDLKIIICFLKSKGLNVDISENIVKGTYSSVWEGEGEITSPADINLFTHEVTILKSYNPEDMTTEDGEPFECECLEDEYILIDNEKFPCINKEEYDKEQLNENTTYDLDKLFWYC